MSERPTLHVVSLSGGKDSTATLLVALELHGHRFGCVEAWQLHLLPGPRRDGHGAGARKHLASRRVVEDDSWRSAIRPSRGRRTCDDVLVRIRALRIAPHTNYLNRSH